MLKVMFALEGLHSLPALCCRAAVFPLNLTVWHIMQMRQVEADFTVYCHSNYIQTIRRNIPKNDKPTAMFTVWQTKAVISPVSFTLSKCQDHKAQKLQLSISFLLQVLCPKMCLTFYSMKNIKCTIAAEYLL